jgi:hypothetical protein
MWPAKGKRLGITGLGRFGVAAVFVLDRFDADRFGATILKICSFDKYM